MASLTKYELKDTVELMLSDDYKQRFKAEYMQLAYRIERLDKFLTKWKRNELDYRPQCDYETLNTQFFAMSLYKGMLETRARIEQIDLSI